MHWIKEVSYSVDKTNRWKKVFEYAFLITYWSTFVSAIFVSLKKTK